MISKKSMILFFILIFIFIVFFYSFINKKLMFDNYEKNIINTEKIRAEDLSELKKENKEIIVYLGRPTCSYCRSFVKLLNKSIKETNSKVYYIQTEKDSTNKALASIRKEYNIEYIPTLIKIKGTSFSSLEKKDNVKSIQRFLKR
ncbi:thioredoxin family protein (plasmid) [Pseudolactococcus raffinolactis]|jgi:predicted bacteriocin transport accessory protein|uniref:thioredoxin family protein n=1 Tax=Pseudolactococcus raffinolactis TaxID=1366 RepID=UPI001436FD64|nr:thioredoxin family protein [Lactococcus raffinolactis]QIW57404.1 thioredoxin family protein [Lactococcus raffinolactis]